MHDYVRDCRRFPINLPFESDLGDNDQKPLNPLQLHYYTPNLIHVLNTYYFDYFYNKLPTSGKMSIGALGIFTFPSEPTFSNMLQP